MRMTGNCSSFAIYVDYDSGPSSRTGLTAIDNIIAVNQVLPDLVPIPAGSPIEKRSIRCNDPSEREIVNLRPVPSGKTVLLRSPLQILYTFFVLKKCSDLKHFLCHGFTCALDFSGVFLGSTVRKIIHHTCLLALQIQQCFSTCASVRRASYNLIRLPVTLNYIPDSSFSHHIK